MKLDQNVKNAIAIRLEKFLEEEVHKAKFVLDDLRWQEHHNPTSKMHIMRELRKRVNALRIVIFMLRGKFYRNKKSPTFLEDPYEFGHKLPKQKGAAKNSTPIVDFTTKPKKKVG